MRALTDCAACTDLEEWGAKCTPARQDVTLTSKGLLVLLASSAVGAGVRCRLSTQPSHFNAHPAQLDEARKKSRTSDLHRQRQILAVLGVVHCPWTHSLPAANTEFTKMCRWAPALRGMLHAPWPA